MPRITRCDTDYGDIVRFCEQTLLVAGRVEEAYRRFARTATHSTTNVGASRQVVEKYPDRDPRSILLDFVAAYTEKGKWFAAAKEAGCLDVALTCAADSSADPATLLRAARDYVVKDVFFAAEVALCALRNLLAGGGYEPTTMDVVQAHQYLMEAAVRCGRTDCAEAELDRLVARGGSGERQAFLHVLVSRRERHM